MIRNIFLWQLYQSGADCIDHVRSMKMPTGALTAPPAGRKCARVTLLILPVPAVLWTQLDVWFNATLDNGAAAGISATRIVSHSYLHLCQR